MSDSESPSSTRRLRMPGALVVPLYRRFWSALALSLTGNWVRITAMGFLVYELTEDELRLGLASFAQAAPVLITAPLAGILLDRYDRRLILLGTQLLAIATMAVVTLLIAAGEIVFWHLLMVSVVLGLVSGFDWPARLAIVPALVPRERLQSAIALNSVAFNTARILGPTLAGWIIGLLGLAWCFGFSATSLIPFAIVVATLGVSARPAATAGGRGTGLADLRAGYRYTWQTPTIRGLLSVDLIPLALGWSYFTMAPAVAREVLGLGSEGLGLLLTINGIGALTGTLLAASLTNLPHRGRAVIIGVACFGCFLVAYGLSSNVWLSGFLILALGLSANFYAIVNDTLIQLLVDDAYRGRVTSIYTMLYGLTPIGGLLVGVLARSIGLQAALSLNGVIILAYVALIWLKTPVREIE